MGLKPGEKAPASGQYGVVGPRGGKINKEVRATVRPLPVERENRKRNSGLYHDNRSGRSKKQKGRRSHS